MVIHFQNFYIHLVSDEMKSHLFASQEASMHHPRHSSILIPHQERTTLFISSSRRLTLMEFSLKSRATDTDGDLNLHGVHPDLMVAVGKMLSIRCVSPVFPEINRKRRKERKKKSGFGIY
ncbi:hypothetical protein CEXT_157641 [Caerostris extrusa]|uniref:Uncharacterized protein n=1 Tax=Caerostris extrusa TaxID=172846 RepID=A0AAV4QWZ8_CAEEX|nr:hypothetical protein CEXT_157641 [Caerostris extrusa]